MKLVARWSCVPFTFMLPVAAFSMGCTRSPSPPIERESATATAVSAAAPVSSEPESRAGGSAVAWFREDPNGKKVVSVWLDDGREAVRSEQAVIAGGGGLWQWQVEKAPVDLGRTCDGESDVSRAKLRRLDRAGLQVVVAPDMDAVGELKSNGVAFYLEEVTLESSLGPQVFFRHTTSITACQGAAMPTTRVEVWDIDRAAPVELFEDRRATPQMREAAATQLARECAGCVPPNPTDMVFDSVLLEHRDAGPALLLLFAEGGGYHSARTAIPMPVAPHAIAGHMQIPEHVLAWKRAHPKRALGGVSVVPPEQVAELRTAFERASHQPRGAP